TQKAANDREDEGQPEPDAGKLCEQIANAAEPCEECRQVAETEHRPVATMVTMPGMTVIQAWQMEVVKARQVEMMGSTQRRDHGGREAHDETDQIDVRYSHTVCPF